MGVLCNENSKKNIMDSVKRIREMRVRVRERMKSFFKEIPDIICIYITGLCGEEREGPKLKIRFFQKKILLEKNWRFKKEQIIHKDLFGGGNCVCCVLIGTRSKDRHIVLG